MLGVMGATLLARPNRAWLLVGVLGGFSVYLFPVGLLLVPLLLAMAVTASIRKQAPAAWVAYLCGAGIVVLPIALAVTAVVSPLVGGLLVAACAAALALGVAGLGLRHDLRVRARGR
jgi:hydrogenase-4 membrane subunit HyfE